MRSQLDDDGAFERFAATCATPLFRAAVLLAGDRHLAQDLVQETLARMFVVWPRRGAIANLEGYSHTVLVRTYLGMRRRRMFFEQPTSALPEPDHDLSCPDTVALRVTLQAALAKLTPADRAVLILRYVHDRSVEQVADDLTCSSAAVRTRSRRALQRLRTALGNDPVAEYSAP